MYFCTAVCSWRWALSGHALLSLQENTRISEFVESNLHAIWNKGILLDMAG